jgi:caffeoyl-CoA O-methyltransferase
VITDPPVETYAYEHTTPAASWLEALERETRESVPMAQMLTGRIEGRFLETLVWVSGARSVLELGTFTGYSALAMAGALGDGGRVVTCEVDPERATFARERIAATPYADVVEVAVGPALESIDRLDGPFDLVFIDADKEGYPAYLEAVLPKLAPRGLIVLDNTLRGGEVAEADLGERARGMAELNDALARDERVVAVLLPVRDGVTLVRRAG